jgi:alpha-tubulin suppressor-like RCC1 family protein
MVAAAIPLAAMLAVVSATAATAQIAMAQFTQLAAGNNHSCALKASGQAFCWGAGGAGALGNGSTMDRSAATPVQMPSGVQFTKIVAGISHTCALGNDSKAYCWGGGWLGQMGNGSNADQLTPVAVTSPGGVIFMEISSTGFHTCALANDSHTYCWGMNDNGQLGNGSTANQSTPVQVNSPAGTSFMKISTGRAHTCGLSNDARTWCWGTGDWGALGNGSTASRSNPTEVSAPSGVTFNSIATGNGHTCAISNEAKAYCWGWNSSGQLGTGDTTDRMTPTEVNVPSGTTLNEVTANWSQSCAMGNDGRPWCWGWSGLAQRLTPVAIDAPTGNWNFYRVSPGMDHACGMANPYNNIYCWGNGQHGRLGNNQMADQSTPVEVVEASTATPPSNTPITPQFTELSAGGEHTCGLANDSNTYCWGGGDFGQLGDGTTSDRMNPVPVHRPAGVIFTQIAVGEFHTCAIGNDSMAYCWGQGGPGQLGDGGNSSRPVPGPVTVPSGVIFTQLAAGRNHTCALGNDAKTYCWGQNDLGQLGDGTLVEKWIPTVVNVPTGVIFTRITAGMSHTCALGNNGKTYCWGYGGDGTIGNGSTANRSTPTAVAAPSGVLFTDPIAGGSNTCDRGNDSKAYCWGVNDFGQLGNGNDLSQSSPVAVNEPAGVIFTDVQTGYDHTCALGNDNGTYCWGAGIFGQLGNGNNAQLTTPSAVSVPGGVLLTKLTSGNSHSCGVGNNGKTYCWGYGTSGQLGNGQQNNQLSPVEVTGSTGGSQPPGERLITVTYTAVCRGCPPSMGALEN